MVETVRASVFTTCLVESLYPNVGDALETLLVRLGVEVDVPTRQTCCGQMHINSGYGSMAVSLIRNHVLAFADSEAVVAPSASCVGAVRHQYEKIALESGDAELVEAVRALANKTYEVSEFLVDVLGVTDVERTSPTESPTIPRATRFARCASVIDHADCWSALKQLSWWRYLTRTYVADSAAPLR